MKISPVRLPPELVLSTIAEMEPGEAGFITASALVIDAYGGVWIDPTYGKRTVCQGMYDIGIQRRKDDTYSLHIPDCYQFPRNYEAEQRTTTLPLIPVAKLEIVESEYTKWENPENGN